MSATNLHAQQQTVWDPYLRIFHWLLVLCFILAQITADDFPSIHEYSGYGILALITFRVIWGVVGPHTARFSTFWPSPSRLIRHISELINGNHTPGLGHNPAGAWMVFALLGTLFLTGLSGYASQTDMFWGVEWIEETHEFLGEATLILVGIHIVAVLLMSVFERRNLVMAMITGRLSTAQSTD